MNKVTTNNYSSLPKTRTWRTQHLSGKLNDLVYPDSHCVLRTSTDRFLDHVTVVAPNGVRLTRSAFVLLCTIPFYANHHEDGAKVRLTA